MVCAIHLGARVVLQTFSGLEASSGDWHPLFRSRCSGEAYYMRGHLALVAPVPVRLLLRECRAAHYKCDEVIFVAMC